ncbi:MAG: bleomycin resistance protein [Verrucomicrobia bacterium]|nr:bleomycin resistance protein [Verrucomicrobiota bacterium]
MKLSGLHHVSILVTDMARARKFYRDTLGMREIGIPSTFPGAGLRVHWFELGDEQVHLIPTPQPDSFSQRHYAMHVDDAQAAREELRRKGVETAETVPIPGADRFFIRDPDGNRIELIQWTETYRIVPVGE